MEDSRTILNIPNVQSLCWVGDDLVDWVSGGIRYHPEGTITDRRVVYGYHFNNAITSPSGNYTVIYERLGTKGALLDHQGKVLQEINRSFYHADDYEYPVVLFILPDGQEVIAHCPDEYNKLEVEETATGKRLTARVTSEPDDFFHSRLTVNQTSTRLLSAGWIWHPFDSISLYDIERDLADPASLDTLSEFPERSCEVNSATFLTSDILVLTSSFSAEDFCEEDPDPRIRPGKVIVYDLIENSFLSIAPLEEEAGTLMPVGLNHVVGFYQYPKLIDIRTGRVLHRWPDLSTGKQLSSLTHLTPPLALDLDHYRFAVADKEKVTIVTIPHGDLNR